MVAVAQPQARYTAGMDKVTRRSFVTGMGAATLLPMAIVRTRRLRPADSARYQFFDAVEAQFVEAACERLIPADATGPGASAAGVPRYLDRQLAGAWGAGEQLYRAGSWQPGSPIAVSRCAQTPASLFRVVLSVINRRLEQSGTPFGRLPVSAQDALLAALQRGGADFPDLPTAAFFASLLTLTVEGFFSNPLHGLRRDRIAWRLGAFPGAHAARALQ